jgi:hypothetical protein
MKRASRPAPHAVFPIVSITLVITLLSSLCGTLVPRCAEAASTPGKTVGATSAAARAAQYGAQVINLSWGTDGESLVLKDAITRAGARGVVVVCSAGNGGRNIDATPYYPASFNLPNLVAVAATTWLHVSVMAMLHLPSRGQNAHNTRYRIMKILAR